MSYLKSVITLTNFDDRKAIALEEIDNRFHKNL